MVGAFAVMSISIDAAAEAALTLPASSVCVAERAIVPSESVSLEVMLQLPSPSTTTYSAKTIAIDVHIS